MEVKPFTITVTLAPNYFLLSIVNQPKIKFTSLLGSTKNQSNIKSLIRERLLYRSFSMHVTVGY